MSANINEVNGKAAFASVKEPAWHNLGQVVDDVMTAEEAIKNAGLDYEVDKKPAHIQVKENWYSVPGTFATYRTDTNDIFGAVGNRYEIVQNREAFSFFDAIVGEGEAIYETAGALGKGEIVFITAKLPDYIRVGKEDDINKYLLLTMSHDGSGAIQAMFTPIRVVCNNTLNAALNSKNEKVSLRHTKSVHENLKEAHKALRIANQLSEELEGIYNQMSNTRISDKQAENYFQNVLLDSDELRSLAMDMPKDEVLSTRKMNILDNMVKYYHIGPGQDMESAKGTVYGVYNAVTGYYQNVKNYSSDSDKFKSNLLGNNHQKMQKAFSDAYKLVEQS